MSVAANYSENPVGGVTALDTVVFDARTDEDAVAAPAFVGSIAKIEIQVGYAGHIEIASDLSVGTFEKALGVVSLVGGRTLSVHAGFHNGGLITGAGTFKVSGAVNDPGLLEITGGTNLSTT